MKTRLLPLVLALMLACLAGCAPQKVGGFFTPKEEGPRHAAVSQYSADSLDNYKIARDYSAQGRYELAREHYLLALAAANDPYLQDALAKELESVNMMIKSLR